MDKNKVSRKGDIQKIILSLIKIGGLITIAALAPNAVQLLNIFNDKKRRYNSSYYIKSTTNKLIKRGLIKFNNDGERRYLTLTETGDKRLLEYQLRDYANQTHGKWDGKWRIIIFDIKEYSRATRDKLRDELINIGFVRVQNSVWVSPHECEEFIFLLKTSFELGRNVLYILADKIENESWLIKEFKLTRQ